MKLLFLATGLVASAAVSAQQKELFDIEQHLKENQAKGKIVYPKYQPPPQVKKSIQELLSPGMKGSTDPYLSYTLPNGDKVKWRTGEMPFVQPDMNQYQVMPNISHSPDFNFTPLKPQPGQIPNASPKAAIPLF